MRKFILISISTLLSTVIFAQNTKYSVSGIIKDKDSGETLSGVVILDENNDGNFSNNYGFYAITTSSGINSLTYRYMGYKTDTITINLQRDTVFNIFLEPSVVQIDDVLVTGHSTRFASTNNFGVASINIEQLKYAPAFLGEQDIFKYLQLLPGVSEGKEGSSGLNIRGGSADQTLILFDDVPIYNQSHAFGFVSIFSGEAIKSADLYKGYSPPMYGGRLSGIASLRMRDGNRYEHKQSILLGTTTISLNAEGPIKKGVGSYLISARRFIPDLFLRVAFPIINSGQDYQDQTLFSFYDIAAKASYDLGKKHSLYLSVYTGNDSFSNEYKVDQPPRYNAEYGEQTEQDMGLRWGNTISSLRWNASLGSNIFMNNTVYYSFLRNEKYSIYDDTSNKDEPYHYEDNIKSKMNEIGVKSNFDQNITSNYNISYGLNYSKQFFDPQDIFRSVDGFETTSNFNSKELSTYALYFNNDFKFNNFHLSAGLRTAIYDNTQDISYSIEPRVALSYSIGSLSSVRASYARNSQPLFSMNQFFFAMPIDYWVPFVDKNIPTSDQYSIGGQTNINKLIDISADVYYKQSNNVSLVYNSSDFLLNDGGVDIVDGRAFGAELSIQYSQGRFSAMGSYTYSNSKHNIKGRWIPFVYDTPHNANLLLSYTTVKKGAKKHTLSVNTRYRTGIPYLLSNEVYPNVDFENQENWEGSITYYPDYATLRLVDYFRLDLNYSMEKRLKKGSRTWQISILNATNHMNPYMVIPKGSGQNVKYSAITIIPFFPSFSYKRTF